MCRWAAWSGPMWRAAKSVITEPPRANAVAGSPSVTARRVPGVAPWASTARSRDACPGRFVCLRGSGDVAPSAPDAYAGSLPAGVISSCDPTRAGPDRGTGRPDRLVGSGSQRELLDLLGELQRRGRPLRGIGGDGPGDNLADVRIHARGDGRRVGDDAAHGQERVVIGQRPVQALAGHGVVQGGAQGEHVAGP